MRRQPTCIDVASYAGVSQATVSRVLNKSALVSNSTRDRVMKAAEQLKYKIDNNARNLRAARVKSIALLILEDMDDAHTDINPFFLPFVSSIVRNGADMGYEVTIALQRESNDWGAGYCFSRPGEGIIFLGSKDFETYAENFRSHDHSDDNWVVWGLDRAPQGKVCVVSDNKTGAIEAVSHLIASGRRRIAYLGKLQADHWEFQERYAGYQVAHRAAGLDLDHALSIDSQLTLDDGANAIAGAIANGLEFDAIFASTDMLALGALRQLQSSGFSVPGDVAIIGFDDLWVCNISSPQLSSVRQDAETAGRALVESVVRLIEGKKVESTRIPTKLIVRGSS